MNFEGTFETPFKGVLLMPLKKVLEHVEAVSIVWEDPLIVTFLSYYLILFLCFVNMFGVFLDCLLLVFLLAFLKQIFEFNEFNAKIFLKTISFF